MPRIWETHLQPEVYLVIAGLSSLETCPPSLYHPHPAFLPPYLSIDRLEGAGSTIGAALVKREAPPSTRSSALQAGRGRFCKPDTVCFA